MPSVEPQTTTCLRGADTSYAALQAHRASGQTTRCLPRRLLRDSTCGTIGLALAFLMGCGEAYAAPAAGGFGSSPSTLAFFGVVLVLTLAVCVWAARFSKSTDEYLTAGSSITATQNGFAIAGDYMSAGAILGLTGAVYASGADGLFLAATYLASWPIVLCLIAEPLRKLGRYSLADVLAQRLKERPIRIVSAVCSLVIICFYLVAQLVGAGELISLLIGIPYRWAVLVAGGLMIAFVNFGGMRGATWVQIVKAVLLLGTGFILTILCLWRFGFNLVSMLHEAAAVRPAGTHLLNIQGFAKDPFATTSLAIGLLFGTAGLPHILMRFFTVADQRAARLSVFYATCLIGLFFVMLLPIGFGSISILHSSPAHLTADGAVRGGSNMVAINLADILGGDPLMGFISAIAFATILAVVSGLLIAGASATTNDLISGIRKRPLDERSRLTVIRITGIVIGVMAVFLAILFEGQNVAYLIALATSIAASANFPLLILSIYWPGLTTTGAMAGATFGLVSSVTLTVLAPTIWSKVLGMGPAIFPYDSPALLTVPCTFLVIMLVSMADTRTTAKTSAEPIG